MSSLRPDTSTSQIGEDQILNLVCDYLSKKGLTETEKTLRDEFTRVLPHQRKSSNQKGGSYLEDLIEKSYVTQMVSGDPSTMNTGVVEDESLSRKRRRTNLDAIFNNLPVDGTENHEGGDSDEKTLIPDPISHENLDIATRLVNNQSHVLKNDPYGSSAPALYQTATFAQPSATTFGDYDYTRSGNPTRLAFETQMAELEYGYRGTAFTTGMAALSAVARLARQGEEIILNDDSYGGTYRLLSKVAGRQGINIRYVDMSGDSGPANLRTVITDKTKLVMIESPTNPMQRICNIKDIATICHQFSALLSVDNTMMSPILLNPIKCGADIVVHSATKFVGGHSDTMAGVVISKEKEVAEQIYFFQNAEGTGLAPFDAWLMLRGLKTMYIRIEKQQQNAIELANFLKNHPSVTEVYYAGLKSHKDYHIHSQQAKGGGAVVCFRTGSLDFSQHIVSVTKLFKITVSFGSVNSLISLPGAMSHASIPAEVRSAREFPEDLVRLAVGIENVEDLINDLSLAFQTYEAKSNSSTLNLVKEGVTDLSEKEAKLKI